MGAKQHYNFPKGLGACADRLYRLKEQRLAQQKAVDALKAEEAALKEHIIQTLPKSQASGIAGKVARVTVVTKEQPRVIDQERFRQYLNRSKRFDLAMALRPSPTAIRDMWDEGREIPGIDKFNVVTVSLNKV